jgi:hypothetical protein
MASERDTRYRGSSPRGCACVVLQRLPERLHKILLLSVPWVFGIVRMKTLKLFVQSRLA